ncbi:MAG: C10 family peptidase [Bacteroidales bacterium]|nr:C10 family peptidase [Bacteroidales bacterium]
MKTMSFALFGAVILFVGCKKDNSETSIPLIEKAEDSYFVDIDSINKLFQGQAFETRGLSSSSSIAPFTLRNETVFYIVNHPNNTGWQIVSSDRRTPPILAESKQGSFSIDTENSGLFAWMMGVAEDMYAIRHAENANLSFSEDEISEHIHFWTKESSRSLDPHPENEGYWTGSSTSVTEVVDTIEHLTNTHWWQGDPYNKYCPLKTDGSGKRALAGCVAIAGAQMLYFLHDKWGIPQRMESTATCTGFVGNYYMTQGNLSATVWADMEPALCVVDACSNPHPEAVMIACIGTRMQMNYGNNGSAPDLSFADMVDYVFNQYGIDCDYASYSESCVKNSLINGLPVIVSAKEQWYPNWNLTIPGHAFLIDGYKRTRVKTTTHYTFHPYDPENYDPTSHPSYDVITYSSPEITSVKMNWGFWTQWYIDGDHNTEYLNDGWYTLTGDWYVTNNSNQYNYHYYRKILYNFSVIS